ncbi:bifunctional folylpolyglutamate synthase/dihydrofolate synthase [Amphibacillus sp. MSJ-3]|uniref:bifunctional folylpolyglutamate synthase/dihydrofolate synthase n=1 Tax=Amphibacillus sp. MSJ-3 TaxID=2841505 RepID=UPI001C0EA938|nr:folylpolyglutamate synthase/dihydrofolate synthase family protein [Amphibacillus sp. MSJ-3]MBU5593604.1 bifunctional folylpolyglutamate synthase/dihydrofolate synthase [Amphibacillus sp. MSJ-3]
MFISVDALEVFFCNRENIGIKPGLARMSRLLRSVGHPEINLPAVHVAGTNGKGSTVTYLASILSEAGYSVGTFTSPSLTTYQAMIQLNGQPISDDLYLTYANQLVTEVELLNSEGNPASNFEIIVAIAIQFFSNHADISVIETGMGGLEDATNVFDPIISIITSIDYDHTAFLGDTIEQIASHKAGIIKPNKPVVIGKMVEKASSIIEDVALEKNARLEEIGNTFQVIWIENQPYYKDEFRMLPLKLKLLGEHQFLNTALAIKASFILRECGFKITEEQIKSGISQAYLPARFEQINDHPIVIIDGAHNKESIIAFIKTVKKYDLEREKILVFAAFKDKPIADMLKLLEPHFDRMIFTTFENQRAEQADRLFNMSNHPKKEKSDNWQEVLNLLVETNTDKQVTFVVGSLDFVGKVRGYFS